MIFLRVNQAMQIRFLLVLVLFLFSMPRLAAQCTTLGQTPATAFPVCGTDTFSQSVVPACVNNVIPIVPPCPNDGNVYQDLNPYWYKFTCFTSGTLGFKITPNNLNDDYDWQIWDITGRSPNEVYTDRNLAISFNWSGEVGVTGASSAGTQSMVCGSTGGGQLRPLFSSMPALVAGHQYLLMISHFTGTAQSGYKLSFGGGTGNITDPKLPALQTAMANCDATAITVKLNKRMSCNTLAADGSDFTINTAATTIIGATGVNCNNGFDMDSLVLLLSNPIPPGNYLVTIKDGIDNNTLRDACERSIGVGNNLPLAILPIAPTPMDSLTTVKCAPKTLQLVFKKNMRCNSIAVDGSDFTITGPSPIAVASAAATCSNNLGTIITVTLATPVVNAGTYQIVLKNGSDGNTILDECGQQTTAGSSLPFTVKDTVSADFTYQSKFGCKEDTVIFLHDGRNAVNQWIWRFDNDGASTQQNQQFIFTKFGLKQIWLTVSNGFCSDSATGTVNLDNELKASFTSNTPVCPEDAAIFTNTTTGKDIIDYNWDFGSGARAFQKDPAPLNYPKLGEERDYTVRLIVNTPHCYDTAVQLIKVLRTCYIAVPNAFTPGRATNNRLYPLNAYKADNLQFKVYNRFGQIVFQTNNWMIRWDGKINGQLQGTGTFVWTLQYTDHDSGQKIFRKGTTLLLR
jgi:gliding motility-associated-like protein